MATTEESVQYALYADGLKVKANTWHARKRIAYGEIELSAVETGSTLNMVRVPAGAKIFDGKLMWDGLGSGVTLSVGDASNTARFLPAVAAATMSGTVSTCGRFHVVGAVASAHSTGCGYEYSCDALITVTTGGGTATGTVKLLVEYGTA